MTKKDEFLTQPSKQEIGEAVAELARSLMKDPNGLASLFQQEDDIAEEELTEEELAEQVALAEQIRLAAMTATTSLPETLAVLDRINTLLWQTIWQDEALSPGELQVTDLILRIGELEAYSFAPWLQQCLLQELSALAENADDEACINSATAVVSTLNGIAHQLFDSNCYDEQPADGIPNQQDAFYEWWPLAMQMVLDMYADDDDIDFDEDLDDAEPEEFNEAQLAFIELSVLEKYQFLAQRLQAFDVDVTPLKPAQLKALQQQDYFDFTEALVALIPELTNSFATEPFGAYTEEELRDFYPQHWQAASEATGGEWQLQQLNTELSDENGDSEINVSFTAFGQLHEWTYTHDSSYSDTSFLDDLTEFAEQHLTGRFVFDSQNEYEIGYAYLPTAAADELQQYLSTANC
ncbi:hypothetical protein [Rheinheimera baltica]|uniref:hypothetical protein n=1 Tax=Rheinheimera baltica TaxID=67576 RepID=UPI00040E638B|nr:hypothetical protein [Rheinheimera baltica]